MPKQQSYKLTHCREAQDYLYLLVRLGFSTRDIAQRVSNKFSQVDPPLAISAPTVTYWCKKHPERCTLNSTGRTRKRVHAEAA